MRGETLKSFISVFVGMGIICAAAMADQVPAKEASKRISAFIKVAAPLAQSGVEEFKVKPAKTVKAMLLALARPSLALRTIRSGSTTPE